MLSETKMKKKNEKTNHSSKLNYKIKNLFPNFKKQMIFYLFPMTFKQTMCVKCHFQLCYCDKYRYVKKKKIDAENMILPIILRF